MTPKAEGAEITLLQLATYEGDCDLVQMLLDHGAGRKPLNAQDWGAHEPSDYAVP